MKLCFTIIIAILIFSGCGIKKADTNVPPDSNKNKTACTAEGKVCPDGTVVSRTGENCEFAACPEMPKVDNKNTTIVFPVENFKERITKKPFGIYITPETSPIQPERFRGYHTGADVEYGDTTGDVPVSAIAAGTIIFSGRVSGYGGVIVIKHSIDNKNYLALYGHLNPATLAAKNTAVISGEKIGILGKGGTAETDGERKHLHFSVYTGSDLNFKGYVQNKEELNKWIDPLTLFPS
jgi:murein DD-endopeptidase MepM/ murein hydrolase activator NlpD